MLQGAASFQQVATPTKGLGNLVLGQAHGVVAAVRDTVRPHGDVAGGQA